MDSYKNPDLDTTYISPSLRAFGTSNRKIRIASKSLKTEEESSFVVVKDEVVLRRKPGAKTYLKARFFEDDRKIAVLSIQTYVGETDNPQGKGYSFVGEEIARLLEFVANIKSVALKGTASYILPDEILARMALSNTQVQSLVKENQELFAEVMRSELTKTDVVALGYRKQQLEEFRKLLEDSHYFDLASASKGIKEEAVWQSFFERNPWIFGYGLSYIYLDSVVEKRLEQIVQGHRVGMRGKRVDALLKSKGVISSLCFVEIKRHRTSLLASKPYRSACWSPSEELSGAVAQVQGSVAAATESIREKLELTDPEGYPTGEEAFNYFPKSYLVIGSLEQFFGEHGVNKEQFRSFELYRRNTFGPEIITFDELYERARFIVQSNEASLEVVE
jgi:hypothetical protein